MNVDLQPCNCTKRHICDEGVALWNQAAAAYAYYEAQSYEIDPPGYRWAIRTYATARRFYNEHTGRQLPWGVRPFAGQR